MNIKNDTTKSNPMNANISSKPAVISTSRLRDILTEVRGAQILAFTALTVPEQKITPFGQVQKLTRVNAVTGARYANAMSKHGESSSEERAWGERDASALVTKRNKDGTEAYYLPVQVNQTSRPLYLVKGPNGRLTAVPYTKVQAYLRPERKFAVAYKDYALKSLVTLAHEGRRYRIRSTST